MAEAESWLRSATTRPWRSFFLSGPRIRKDLLPSPATGLRLFASTSNRLARHGSSKTTISKRSADFSVIPGLGSGYPFLLKELFELFRDYGETDVFHGCR